MDRLLARIGLAAMPAPDVDGLRELHRAYVGTVPYEALAVQLGESVPLDSADLLDRVVSGGRGGYYLIDVDDLDAALGWAAKMPNITYGSVEVRPIVVFD